LYLFNDYLNRMILNKRTEYSPNFNLGYKSSRTIFALTSSKSCLFFI